MNDDIVITIEEVAPIELTLEQGEPTEQALPDLLTLYEIAKL